MRTYNAESKNSFQFQRRRHDFAPLGVITLQYDTSSKEPPDVCVCVCCVCMCGSVCVYCVCVCVCCVRVLCVCLSVVCVVCVVCVHLLPDVDVERANAVAKHVGPEPIIDNN